MIDTGAVGSYTDIATLVVASITLYRVKGSQDDGHAVAAALAERVDGVDDDRVRAVLDVEDRDSEQFLLNENKR